MILKDLDSKGRPNVFVFCIMSLNLSMCIMYIFWAFSLQYIFYKYCDRSIVNFCLYKDQTKSFEF